MTTSLPLQLRDATRALHRQAEETGFMRALVQGRLPLAAYLALLAQLLPLYEALEAALQQHRQVAWLAGLDFAALARSAALRQDLGLTDAAAPLQPATASYVARLAALARAADPALLAHVYTRYLGDLHGGQVMRRVVQRHYPGQGTAFLEFGDPAAVQQLRERLGRWLGAAPLSETEQARVVVEACWSFEQHQLLFEELAAFRPPSAPGSRG